MGGQPLHAGQAADGFVQEAEFFRFHVLFRRQGAGFQAHFQICQMLHLVQKPPVDFGDMVDGLMGHAALERLIHTEGALGILHRQMLDDLLGGQLLKGGQRQGVQPQFGGGDRLHHGMFKAVADGHDLAGGHHLGAQRFVRVDEFVKGPLGVFHHHVVQRRFKAGAGLAGDVVGDLVQRVAQRDLGGHLGDGIAGGLGGQRRGAGHAGVHLDDRVLKAVRLEGKLAVAAALDAQLGDDVQRRRAQHLVFLVREGLAGGHHDGVAGVDANRVQVLHVADGDDVALGVPHHLVLDLLPAGDALFHQNLVNGRQAQAVGGDLPQLFRVLADAAAGTAHGEGRAHDDGVADLARKLHGVVQLLHHLGGDDGLVQLFHGVLEQLAVLGAVDGVGTAGQQTHTAAVQIAGTGQLHGQVQAHLAAQIGQDGVGTFFFNDTLHHLGGERLDVHVVGNVRVGHDGGRVGVDQHGLHALGFEGAAGLRAGIVKLRRLTDDDRAGTDDQHLFNGRILRHQPTPFAALTLARKRSNKYSVSLGPPLASGWNCTVKQFHLV